MEKNHTTDFKSNVADLTKIPPNEFEKYFQDWMERDDVARSLQAKLRCDLIKNFNKTNLGKHILSHTMTSSGGSTLRLTLSPLILSLNTLVAEFLYAQNCHFTLSVFCTEIPFRNTLPDFESMRRFRFNNEEICEIWKAVTGSKANKSDLNKNIIQNYENNSNISLLLLIIKCLLKKDPLEQLKRNAEVQTEIQETVHKSISAQDPDYGRKSSSKTAGRDDNLHYINKYLLTLSEKVVEMTKEFEQFAKQTREARPRKIRSSRSREYYVLNKSLERITETMKVMAQSKRKNKHLSTIVESIDNLTQQFGKCAQNFGNVTKILVNKEDKPTNEKSSMTKVKYKEKQTETDRQERSYAEWIHEMRNTENGQKFLNRVEIALRKALTKHRDQLQNETNIRIKQLKSLMRLHYEQKLSKHLLKNPTINLEEAHKCNDTIQKKLQDFESKQLELLQKLEESSIELREAQQQQAKSYKHKDIERNHSEKGNITGNENLTGKADQGLSKQEVKSCDLRESEILVDDGENVSNRTFETSRRNEEKTSQTSARDISKTQEQILDIVQNVAEQGRSVDRIIYDAKLRIQQLENESNQLDQNFQSYLERRKRIQEQENNDKNKPELSSNLKDLYQITSARLMQQRRKSARNENEKDEEIDEEFYRLREKLLKSNEPIVYKEKSTKSESSTSSLEIRNAILEAKIKFFEHENTIRKCREQGEEIRSGNFLQKQLEKSAKTQELSDYFNHNFGKSISEINFETQTEDRNGKEFNIESGFLQISNKNINFDDEQHKDLSSVEEFETRKIEGKTPIRAARELFHIDMIQKEKVNDTLKTTLPVEKYLRYHEPVTISEQYSKGQMTNQIATQQPDKTSELIKQSMAKMQQLFEQQSKSQDTLRDMVNDLQHEKNLQIEEIQNPTNINHRPNEALDKSLTTTTTTITSTTTATSSTNATKTTQETEMKNKAKFSENLGSLNRISNTSMPYLLDSSSDSESSIALNNKQTDLTPEANPENECSDRSTITKQQHVQSKINLSSESSELESPHLPNKIDQEPAATDLQLEFGQLNDSPKVSVLNAILSAGAGNGKETGEIFTESNRTFPPIDDKLDESFSSQSNSFFEISTGHHNKEAKNLADDSESDFWA